MPKRRKQKWQWPGWSKWVLIGLVLLLIAWFVFDLTIRDDLRARSAIGSLESGGVAARDRIRTMGKPFQSRFESALLAGGRSFEAQEVLTHVLLVRPFYARKAVGQALKNDDVTVRRAAAIALLESEGDPTARPERIRDDVFTVLAEWMKDPADRALHRAIGLFLLYSDPRVVDLLLPLVALEPEGTPEERSRIAETRFRAVRRLSAFASEERVTAALKALLDRPDEPGRLRKEAITTLATGGQADPSIYWDTAKSDVAFERQILAQNLALVKDPRVLPVLLHLLGDENIDVRRAALVALMRKRAPQIMKELHYLAEDEYYGIRADLAQAVGQSRETGRIPFLVWLIQDTDPEVVRLAYVELFRMTKEHHGFSDLEWDGWGRLPITARAEEMKRFMNDEERKEGAVAAWSKTYPPRKTDRDRVPHLIRMLMHHDSRNVERAMKNLVRITKRREGFPKALLDRGIPVEESANARAAFMGSDREKLAAEWREWWR